MPGPYRGYLTQRTTQQNHAKPRHQLSDRDQRAQQCLKAKLSKAQIHDVAYITLGSTALQTVQQTFDPGFQVLFHLSSLQVLAEKGTIPTLYVIQTGRHCMPTADYYFSNIKPDPIVIPPCSENKDAALTKQQQVEDPISEDQSPLKPGETRVSPSAILTNTRPVLDITNTTVTSELDLCPAFHSLNLCSLEKDSDPYGREKSIAK